MQPDSLPPFVYLHNNYTYRLKLGFYAAPSNPKLFSKTVRNELDKLKYSYNSDLKGLVMGFGRISSNQVIPADYSHNINVSVNVDIYIFRPPIGSVIEAVVNQVSESHVGCLVLELFNVSIVRPENKPYRCWQGSKVKKDDKINVRILSFDTTKKLPHITGEIVSNSDNLLSDSGAASESEAEFFSTKASSKVASESDTERETEVIMKSCPNSSSSSPLHSSFTQNVSGSEHSVNSLSVTRHKRFEQMQKHLEKKKTASQLQSQVFIKPSEQGGDQTKFVSDTNSPTKMTKSPNKAIKSAINDSFKLTNTSLNHNINNDLSKREISDSKKKKTHQDSTNTTNSPSALTKLNQSGTKNTDSSNSSSSDEENKSLMKLLINTSLTKSPTNQESKNKTPKTSNPLHVDSAYKENPMSSVSLDSSSSDEYKTVKMTNQEKLQMKTTSDTNSSDSSDDEMFESLKFNQAKKEKTETLSNSIQTNKVLKKKTNQESTNATNSPSALTKLNQSGTKNTDSNISSSSDEENESLMKSLVNKSLSESQTNRESMNKSPRKSTAQSTSLEKGQTKTNSDSHNSSDSSDDEMFESLKMNQAKNDTLHKPIQTNKVTFQHQTSSSEDKEKESPMKRQTDKPSHQSPTSKKPVDKKDSKNIMESPSSASKIKAKQKKRLTLSERTKRSRDAAKNDSSSDEGGMEFFKRLSTSTPKNVDNVKKDNNISNVTSDSSSNDNCDTTITVKNDNNISNVTSDSSSSDNCNTTTTVKKDNNISNVTSNSSSGDNCDTTTTTKNNTVKTTITSQSHAKDQPNAKCNWSNNVRNSSSESSDNEMYKSLKMIIAKKPRETLGDSKKLVTINNVTFCDTSSSSSEDEKELLNPLSDKNSPQSRIIDNKPQTKKSLPQKIKHDSSFSSKVVNLKDEDNCCTNENNNLSSTELLDKEKSRKNTLSISNITPGSSPKVSGKRASLKKNDTETNIKVNNSDDESVENFDKIGNTASPHKYYEGKRKKCFKLPLDLMTKKGKNRLSVKKEHLLNHIMSGRYSSDRSGEEMYKSTKINTNKKESEIVSNSKRTVTINNVILQGTSSNEDDKDPNRDFNCLNGISNKVSNTIKNPTENDNHVCSTSNLPYEQDVVDGKNRKKKSKKKSKCDVSEMPLIENVKCSPKSPTMKSSGTKNSQAEIINRLTLRENDSNSEDNLTQSINEILKSASTKLSKDGKKMKKNSKIPLDPTRSDEDTTQTGKLKRLSNPTSVLPNTNNHLNDKNSEDETCKSKKKKKTKIKEHKKLSKTGKTFHDISSSEDETMLLTKSLISKSVPVKTTVKISAEENKCTDGNGDSSQIQTTETTKKKKKKKKDIQNITVDSPSIKTKHTKVDNTSIQETSRSEDEIKLLNRSLVSKLSRKSPTKVAAKKVDKSTNNKIHKNIDVSLEDVENTSALVSATTKTTKKKKSKENKNVVMMESPSTSKKKTKQEKIIKKIAKEQCDSSSSEDENELIMKSLHSKSPTTKAMANVSVKTANKPSGLTEAIKTPSSNQKAKIKKNSNKIESAVQIESEHSNSLTTKQKPRKNSTQADIIKKLCQDANDSSSEEDECSLINKILKQTTKRVKGSKKEKKVSKVPSKSLSVDKSLSTSKISKAVPSNTAKVLTPIKRSSGNSSEDAKTHKSPKQSSTVKEKRKSQKFKFTNLTSHQDSSSSEDEHNLLIKSIMLNKSLPTSLKTKKSIDNKNNSFISKKDNFSPGKSVADDSNIKKKSKIKTGSPLSLKGTPSNTREKSPTPKLLSVSGKKRHRVEVIEQITQPKINSKSKKRPLTYSNMEEISKKKKKKV
ncbi:serine-rich adhesin for platelets-like [Adelges cooleyi]|uniref:serine-rich adhesin for platelets-like n=1 Tax=Adelges cooleyi TaxID=133065 RepID=UPI00217FE715|nr:serine-rich adhesin for platelets-like [Adelges cooleyi]